MQIISTKSSAAISLAISALRCGSVILIPTETVYGLACLWSDPLARARIFHLKQRSSSKHLQMLAASVSQAISAGVLPSEELQKISASFWPGPLTLVCAAKDDESIGLRIPQHSFLLELLAQLGEPLAASSANISGGVAALSVEDALKQFVELPGLVIDDGKINNQNAMASTVAKLENKEITVLREGKVKLEELQNAINC
jgi:L-threonylcarbamoyladenylate synthase